MFQALHHPSDLYVFVITPGDYQSRYTMNDSWNTVHDLNVESNTVAGSHL